MHFFSNFFSYHTREIRRKINDSEKLVGSLDEKQQIPKKWIHGKNEWWVKNWMVLVRCREIKWYITRCFWPSPVKLEYVPIHLKRIRLRVRTSSKMQEKSYQPGVNFSNRWKYYLPFLFCINILYHGVASYYCMIGRTDISIYNSRCGLVQISNA